VTASAIATKKSRVSELPKQAAAVWSGPWAVVALGVGDGGDDGSAEPVASDSTGEVDAVAGGDRLGDGVDGKPLGVGCLGGFVSVAAPHAATATASTAADIERGIARRRTAEGPTRARFTG
jgi:hypothetical protein